MKRLTLILAAFFLASPVFATTVPVIGTIRLPNGGRFNGTIKMTLNYPGRDSCSSNVIVPMSTTFRVQNGSVQSGAALTPNDCIQPSNTIYVTEYFTSAGQKVMENNFSIATASQFDIGTATPTAITSSNIAFDQFTGLAIVDSKKINNMRMCDAFPGATAGAKIIACIADLPASGGMANACGLEGAQSATTTITISKPVILQFCGITLTSSANPAFDITSPNVRVDGGSGQGSSIVVTDGDAFHFSAVSAVGGTFISNIAIDGGNGTTRVAFYQPGTTDSADELWGVTISDVIVTNFNQCVSARTTRYWTLRNLRCTHINSGVVLVGANFNWDLDNVRVTLGNGNGSGNADGLYLDQFTYTTGGSIAPESINTRAFFANGFTGTGIKVAQAIHVNFPHVDISSKGVGISIGACAWDCVFGGGVEMQTTAATACVAFTNQGSINTQVNITVSTHCVSNGATNAIAYKFGTNGGAGNQAYIKLRDCSSAAFTGRDVEIYNSGDIEITGCNLYSSGNAASIYIDSMLTGRRVWIHHNPWLQGYIKVGNTPKAWIDIGPNGGTYSTYLMGRSTIANGTSSVTTTYQSLLGNTAGTTPAFAAQADTGLLLVTRIINQDDNSSGIVTVNAVAGTTSMALTTNTATSADVHVFWEVVPWVPNY